MSEKDLLEGRITGVLGGFYYVDTEEGQFVCRARGRFRVRGQTPLAGDKCMLRPEADGEGYLSELLPRKTQLVRPAVANLDTLFIVCSAAPPVTDVYMIDKLTAIAEHVSVEPVIVINKWDAKPGTELFDIYSKAGYKTIAASAHTGLGTEDIRAELEGKLSAFTGNSGVGKSSLLNAVLPELGLETGDISSRIGRGRNTTRKISFFKPSEGTYVADTPGFSAFDLDEMGYISAADVAYEFREFRPFLDTCRYVGCSHTKERGCSVIEAVNSGTIAPSRHESYKRLYESMRSVKEWEIKRQ